MGTKKMIPTEDMYSKIAENLKKFKIEGLLIIGGFEVSICRVFSLGSVYNLRYYIIIGKPLYSYKL